jgi:hypothetical protein
VKNSLGKIIIRSIKLKNLLCKNEKLAQLKWKIRSVNMENPLGKNGKSAQ